MNADPNIPPRPPYRLDRDLPSSGAIASLFPVAGWMTWDYTWNGTRWTKPPRSGHTGATAGSTDPSAWATYHVARATQKRLGLAGVGFSLDADPNLIGIDLDHCLDGEGEPEAWTAEILNLAETYAEFSPSGRGLRLLARGSLPSAIKCDPASVEIYATGRYLTLTGAHMARTPDEIRPAPKTLAALSGRAAAFKERTSQKRKAKADFRIDTGVDFFANVKAAALASLDRWVPELFPNAIFQPGTGAWRVSSRDLGRDLEEDLSLAPSGIQDFGEERGLNAIQVVEKWGRASSGLKAALWLCEKMGIVPDALGYEDRGQKREKAEAGEQHSTGPGADDWPDPTPIVTSLPPVQPFTPDLLPAPLRDYCFDVADRQQAPVDFVAVVALCALGAVLGNRVRAYPKLRDDWLVTPNIWGAIIGRPSAMKTPGMRAALTPLYRLQDRMREDWLRQSQEAKVEAMLAGFDAKEAKKQAEKAMKAGNKDAAREIIEAMLKVAEGDEGSPPRLIVNDATVEKLGELLNENPRGLLLERDELPGWLARMSREEFQGERAFYLEAFNGDGQFTYDRIGRGTVHIENCTLSVIGGAQPSKIAHLVRGALTGENDDGLVQRLQLAAWPDDIHSWKWVDRQPNGAAREAYDRVFEDLNALALARVESPLTMRFGAEGHAMFRRWMTEIQTEARTGNIAPALESHLLKMPKTIASLALIFELVDGGRIEIGGDAMAKALEWADYLRSHAKRLYASADSAFDDAARLILERRAQLPSPFSARDVHRRGWAGITDRDVVEAALTILIDAGYCRAIRRPAGKDGGRPTSEFRWHPSLGG